MPNSSGVNRRIRERRGDSYSLEEQRDHLNSLIEEINKESPASSMEPIELNGRTRIIYGVIPTKSRRSKIVEGFASIVATLRATLPEGTNLILWVVLFFAAISELLVGNWLVWQAVASSQILK